MVKERIPIPKETERELLVECGHRCSVTGCHSKEDLMFHHINFDPSDNQKDNIIVLCPTHAAMADKGKIDRKACKIYKEKLNGLSFEPLPSSAVLDGDDIKSRLDVLSQFKLFSNDTPHFEFLIVPKILTELIPLDEKSLSFLMNIRPDSGTVCVGQLEPLQHGFISEFRFEKWSSSRGFQITKDGIVQYKESLEDNVIDIGRMITLIGNIFFYSKRLFENFKYSDHAFLTIKLNNITNYVLTSSGRDIYPYKFKGENITINRSYLLGQNPETEEVTASIIDEVCRSFGCILDTNVIHEHVHQLLSKQLKN